uniref:RNA polymerase sigma-70 factor n=3 Tax=unclassified Prevotella TaxID=2638335 RepID=A0AB33JGA7_9BACT
MNDSEDKFYIRLFTRGDSKALEILFMKYQPKLVNFITGFVKDREVARDMSQNIFMKLWQNRSQFRDISNFQAFLFTMARSTIYNYFDHELVIAKFMETQLKTPIVSDDIEEQLFATQLQQQIDDAIAKMPKQRRLVFTMSRKEGFSNAEIAAELNISKRTVENHLTAALTDIRQVIKLFIIMCAIG